MAEAVAQWTTRPAAVLGTRDFWRLRLYMWVNRRRALRRGVSIVGTPDA